MQHNKTRLFICRSIFLLFAFLPFVATVSWATYRNVVLDAAFYRHWIATQTGLDLKLQGVVHVRPHVTRFEGLNIVDPEDGELIARCSEAVVRHGEYATGIHFSAITIQPDQFRRLLELVHDRVLRQQRLIARPVYVVADSVSLPGRGRELKLTELRLDAERTANGPEALLTFRWAERPESELVRLHLLRDQTAQPATTRIDLMTGDTPLPCSLFCKLSDPFSQWTDDMTFRGNLHMSLTSAGWRGELTGFIANLNLEQLAVAGTTDIATGPVSLTIRRANFRGSWMESLAGRFEAGPGQIGRSTLLTIHEHLKMTLKLPESRTSNESIEYEKIAVDFDIDRHAARFLGACQSPTAGVVIRGPQGPLVLQSPEPSTETISLARAMLGLTPTEVPVSPQSQPWMRILPLGL